MKCPNCDGENCQTYAAILNTQVTVGVEKSRNVGLSASPIVLSGGLGKTKTRSQTVLAKRINDGKPPIVTPLHVIGGFAIIYFVVFAALVNITTGVFAPNYQLNSSLVVIAAAFSIIATGITTYYLWDHILKESAKSQNIYQKWEDTCYCNSCSHHW